MAHNSLNELIDLHGSLWNQARAGPFKLAGTLCIVRVVSCVEYHCLVEMQHVIIRIGGAIIHGKMRYDKALGRFVAQNVMAQQGG